MCGIAGAVAAGRVDPVVVERMRDRLAHRGPDASGLWSTRDGRVCLGHRRLSIVDLSPEANQPMLSADGRLVVSLNGELYNFRALRRELEQLGSAFRTSSDTEVLLEAYRHWGTSCLERISGMFAFALWDARDRVLFCARDRAGEKPFHYTVVDGAFVFASELKALPLWPGFRRAVDQAAVADFLTFGAIPDPRTIWEGTYKLPPAHFLLVSLEGDRVAIGEPLSYWDMAFAPASGEDWGELVRRELEDAAAEMSFADVPVGTFLSGGIDSSSVTAALARRGSDVESFTVGFADADYDERPWAETVAGHLRAPFRSRLVEASDVEAVFRETILWHFDEPLNDHSYLPTYYVSKAARERVTVALTGDGADETFAGYPKYRLLARRSALEARLGRPGVQLAAAGARAVLVGGRMRRRLRPYELGSDGMLSALMTTVFDERELRAAARGDLAAELAAYDPFSVVRRHLELAPVAEVGLVNAMRYLDLKLTLGAGILTKVDRASMAVSLEARPVYLHRRLLDLAGRIPARLLADGTEAKKVLRDAFRPWLPAAVLDRPKQGFAMPFSRWLRGDLGSMLADRVEERPVAQLVEPAAIRRLAAEHASGRADRGAKLHALLFLDHWLERWA
jgi:asparagine synthase (glutamine-hydrolysing)